MGSGRQGGGQQQEGSDGGDAHDTVSHGRWGLRHQVAATRRGASPAEREGL
jgi:hypothetical protein